MDQIKDQAGPTAPSQHPQAPVRQTLEAPRACYFLSLPPELRNLIYKFLLISKAPIKPRGPYRLGSPFYPPYPEWRGQRQGGQPEHPPPPPRPNTEHRETLALACTCQQDKDEALSLYYGVNAFNLGTSDAPCVQLYLSPLAERLITRVVYDYQGNSRGPDLKAIAKCSNLHHLKINIGEYTTQDGSMYPKNLFRAFELRALKKMRCNELVVTYVPGLVSQGYFPNGRVEEFTKMLMKVLWKPWAD